MVGYGSKLRRARRPGWQEAYLDYERLKSILEEIESLHNADSTTTLGIIDDSSLLHNPPQDNLDSINQNLPLVDVPRKQARRLAEEFLTLLQTEVEKIGLFALARQGELADAVGALRFASHQPHLRISIPSGNLSAGFYGAEDDDEVISVSSDDDDNDSSWRVGGLALGETAALLPRVSSRSSLRLSTGGGPPSNGSLAASLTTSGPTTQPMFRGLPSHSAVATAGTGSSSRDNEDTTTQKMDAYSSLGVELLHLIRYICVNAMGVRKILKKHDKLVSQKMLGGYYQQEEKDSQESEKEGSSPLHRQHRGGHHTRGHSRGRSEVFDITDRTRASHKLLGGADMHLQQLANSGSIAAMHASLSSALAELPFSFSNIDNPSRIRLECVVSSVQALREAAEVVNTPFKAFLSRKAMIFTGHDLGGLEGTTRQALDFLLDFKPSLILRMDAPALLEWRERTEEHVLAHPRLQSYVTEIQGEDTGVVEYSALGGINTTSMMVNLMSTLLYTVNYYIVAPTANHYAILLGTDGAYGATLVGASSFTALFAAFLYSWWNTNYSYKSALFFSSLCPCIGNLLYSYAISRSSLAIAMSGRLLVGFGSAEVVNRQIISTCVSFQSMTQASALFVAAGALGMSVGPFLAAILDTVAGRDVEVDLEVPWLGGIIFDHVTSPGFVMAVLWFVEILAIVFSFQEPKRINVSSTSKRPKNKKNSRATNYGTGDPVSPEEEKSLMDNARTRKSFLSVALSEIVMIKNLVFRNPALPITLLLFAYIECVDEVLISSCSMVCRRYFNWHGSTAGFIIASLGALVLPAHFVVEHASRHYDERAIMKYSLAFIIASLIAILNYQGMITDTIGLGEVAWEDVANNSTNSTIALDLLNADRQHMLPYDWGAGVYIYLIALAATFLGTIVLEGVDTSLMSKVTPSKLNDSFVNCGLLATLIGTLGRVLGDSTITFSALIDHFVFTDFVSDTFFPMIPLALLGYYFVKRHYNKLL